MLPTALPKLPSIPGRAQRTPSPLPPCENKVRYDYPPQHQSSTGNLPPRTPIVSCWIRTERRFNPIFGNCSNSAIPQIAQGLIALVCWMDAVVRVKLGNWEPSLHVGYHYMMTGRCIFIHYSRDQTIVHQRPLLLSIVETRIDNLSHEDSRIRARSDTFADQTP